MRGVVASVEHVDVPAPAELGPVVWAADVTPLLEQPYLVKDIILAGALVVIFGEANSGKTFLALDLGFAIATGRAWFGKKTRRALVLYCAGEGGHGTRNRIAAYRARHPEIAGSPFALLAQPVNLLDPLADVGRLIELAKKTEAECGESLALVTIDTLSRALAGGDENSSESMTALVANADRLRAETGAAVAFVHHCGKVAAHGARGHSSLRGAVDTEIAVEGQSGPRVAKVTKQRDLPSGLRLGFELEPVVIGADSEDKQPVTSCVVRELDVPAVVRRDPSGKNQQALLAGIREWLREHPGSRLITRPALNEVAKGQGLTRSVRREEAIKGLHTRGYLSDAVGGFIVEE